ncbi:hypothetical protein ILYODFUR_024393 [Ilyodon furcidens]|uniref:Uncharacterized protein n=1 Tax=Ilyodon furcidens TaxID=33524 RepID=A0ABV0U9T2_9TELE
MLITAMSLQQRVCRPSRPPVVINPLCCQLLSLTRFSPLSEPTCITVRDFGIRLGLLSNAPLHKTSAMWTERGHPLYAPGQEVWMSSQNFPLKAYSKKLAPRFFGPL